MADDGGGYSGRVVLVLLVVASVAVALAGILLIRPEPDAAPAPVNRRPFGPATAEDYANLPLIEKGRARAAAQEAQEAGDE